MNCTKISGNILYLERPHIQNLFGKAPAAAIPAALAGAAPNAGGALLSRQLGELEPFATVNEWSWRSQKKKKKPAPPAVAPALPPRGVLQNVASALGTGAYSLGLHTSVPTPCMPVPSGQHISTGLGLSEPAGLIFSTGF